MIFTIQRLFGFLLLLAGVVFLFAHLGIGAGLLVAGFLMISLAEIVEVLRSMHRRQLGTVYTEDQFSIVVSSSPKPRVFSQDLQINPIDGERYPLLTLDGELYLRAKPLLNYMEQEDKIYRFSFPEVEPVALICESFYTRDCRLFGFHDQVFVKLNALPLAWEWKNGELTLSLARESDALKQASKVWTGQSSSDSLEKD
ncbi:hypothetical protein [Paenibacillus sp. NPDC058071]|uniref:hypothetical protein n=1 Tax=Paenibacillus sp. NPDC058071 TaxID=3346326 RepID=UPI0036DCE67B